jgi:predicted acetyltransferase
MTTSFRIPKEESELAALADILTEAFSITPDKIRERFDFIGHDNLRVLERGSTIAGGLWVVPMGQFFGGRSVPNVGIAGVGVRPDFRGHGVAHELMSRTVNECRDKGIALSGLYPATQALYRRSGYEAAGHRLEINLRLDSIRIRERAATMRRLEEGDRPRLETLYRQVAQHRDGYLDRVEYLWDRVFRPMGEATRGYGVFEGDELEGYLYLKHRDKVDGFYHLSLTDFIFSTPRAGRRLLAFLAGHSSMAGEVRWYGGPNDPALYLLSEQRYKMLFRFFWMIRITHLEAALSARGYPVGLETELHLDIADDIVPAHNGKFVLQVADGKGTVKRGGRGDLGLDIRGLTALYTGFLSPDLLKAAGRAEGSDDALRRAGAAFAGPTPTMADMF